MTRRVIEPAGEEKDYDNNLGMLFSVVVGAVRVWLCWWLACEHERSMPQEGSREKTGEVGVWSAGCAKTAMLIAGTWPWAV